MSENTENTEVKKDSPFVTIEDTFDVSVNYYRDGKKVIVEGTDGFDDKREKSNIVFTIRYPSQADCESIMLSCKDGIVDNDEKIDMMKFMRIELMRFLTLVKAWNLDEKVNNQLIMNLHPDIIRMILIKTRNEIGTNGII